MRILRIYYSTNKNYILQLCLNIALFFLGEKVLSKRLEFYYTFIGGVFLKKYDIQISNLKGLLMFFVLLGHYLLVFDNNQLVILDVIYSFHMPTFIFISGLFSQKVTIKKVSRLFFLFLTFQPLFLLLGILTGYYKTITWQSLLTPAFHLWYLPALAIWLAISLLLSKLGKHSFVAYSIVFLLLLAAVTNRFFYGTQLFTITRILSFSPYFLAGYYMTPNRLSALSTHLEKYRLITYPLTIALIFSCLMIFKTQPQEYLNLFYGFVEKNGFSSTNFGYVLNVSAAFVLGFLWLLLLIIVTPKKWTPLASVGNHTLWLYILHPILFYLLMTKKELLTTFNPTLQFTLALLLTFSIFSIYSMFYRNKRE